MDRAARVAKALATAVALASFPFPWYWGSDDGGPYTATG